MARYIIGSNVTVNGVPYYRDQVAELTSAQASAVTGAGGKLRAATGPVTSTVITTYPLGGATVSSATAAGSPSHDTSGEATGVSN